MGNSHQQYESLQIKPQQWEKISQTPTHELMRNINTHQEGNYYHFNISGDQKLDDQLSTYMYRANTNDNVVKVLGVQSDEKGFGFCGSQMFIRVMTEKIVKKLSDITNLNGRDQLSVLYNSFLGYGSIFKKFKGVKVTSDMIGFNEQGQTKVWVNQNFGMNKKIDLRHDCETPENMMVRGIMEAVESSSSSEIPREIKNNLLVSQSLDQAAAIVAQFVRGDQSVLNNFVQVNQQSNVFAPSQSIPQSNTLPPLRYNEEPPRQPSSSFYSINNRNSNMMASPTNREIGQTRFTSFSGTNGVNNSQMMQSGPMYNRQVPSMNGDQRFENLQPRSNIRFSYEKQ